MYKVTVLQLRHSKQIILKNISFVNFDLYKSPPVVLKTINEKQTHQTT